MEVSQGVGRIEERDLPDPGPCEREAAAAGADIKVSQKQVHAIRSMKLESQRYGSLSLSPPVESYHDNIRDRAPDRRAK